LRRRTFSQLSADEFAERAKSFAALKGLEELRLEGGNRPVVHGLLPSPHTNMRVSGFERGRSVPALVFTLLVEARADGLYRPAEREDCEGWARRETKARPRVGRNPRQVLACEDRSVFCVESVSERPFETCEVCAVGAAAGKDRREGLRLEEAGEVLPGVAQRRMRRWMGHEIHLHEVVKRRGPKRPGERAKVAPQGVLDPDEVGVGVDRKALFGREASVASEERRKSRAGGFLNREGSGDPLRIADQPPEPALEPADFELRIVHAAALLSRARGSHVRARPRRRVHETLGSCRPTQ